MLSRGIVVPTLLAEANIFDLSDRLAKLSLKRLPPFRLIALSSAACQVRELRWNATGLDELAFDWKAHHWFSSGSDEAAVQHQRNLVCREAWKKPNAGTLRWLRALHRSHAPNPGPFSICRHGSTAATVSYIEILAGRYEATMRYHPGPPCGASIKRFEESISLNSDSEAGSAGYADLRRVS